MRRKTFIMRRNKMRIRKLLMGCLLGTGIGSRFRVWSCHLLRFSQLRISSSSNSISSTASLSCAHARIIAKTRRTCSRILNQIALVYWVSKVTKTKPRNSNRSRVKLSRSIDATLRGPFASMISLSEWSNQTSSATKKQNHQLSSTITSTSKCIPSKSQKIKMPNKNVQLNSLIIKTLLVKTIIIVNRKKKAVSLSSIVNLITKVILTSKCFSTWFTWVNSIKWMLESPSKEPPTPFKLT